jgi:hypothetical protein
MPTPEDDTVTGTIPLAHSLSWPGFASCPPELDREIHAPRESRTDASTQPEDRDSDGGATPDARPDHVPDATANHIDTPKDGEHAEDACGAVQEPSPVGSPHAPSENEAHLTRHLATAVLEPSTRVPRPRYLQYAPMDADRVCCQEL